MKMRLNKFFSNKMKKEAVRIDFNDLTNPNKNLSQKIHDAFGKDALGIAIIKNIPNFIKARNDILEYGKKIVLLKNSKEIMQKYTKPKVLHQIGWSYGFSNPEKKEIADLLQGAYNNRIFDDTKIFNPKNSQLEDDFRNIWPGEETPELNGLKEKFLNIGEKLYSISKESLKHLDKYLVEVDHKIPRFFLQNYLKSFDSQSTLMPYFPYNTIPENKREEYRNKINWISWHRDFSCLTTLVKAKHFTTDGLEYKANNGLIIKDRYGVEHDCTYDEDEAAMQIGDALYILSGGHLMSTPHAVRTNNVPDNVMRTTFVSFMDPRPEQIIKPANGEKVDEVLKKDPSRNIHSIIGTFKENMQYQHFIEKAVYNFFK